LAGPDFETLVLQLGEQFDVDEVDLAQVWLGRVGGDAGSVLHGDPGVSVALDAKTSQQGDLFYCGFTEPVFAIAADADHHGLLSVHIAILPVAPSGREATLTHPVTPAGPPLDPHNSSAVRHGWLFVAILAVWTVLVVFIIFAAIHHFRDDVPFDLTFWINAATAVLLAADLIRTGRLRWSARH